MMQLFDTHTHLLDERFNEDREALLKTLPEKGIVHILEAGTFAGDSEKLLHMVENCFYAYAALGTHPHDAKEMRPEHMDELKRCLQHEKAVAVGEIGLDYHYDFSPRDVQRRWFAQQLDLAQELCLPVVLHVREATQDAMALLRERKNNIRGVMHCFSGSYETAKECLDMGLYVAFGGVLTYKNAKKNVEVAQKLPMERLLIETDCPYMAPVPHRGERNDPSLVKLVCEKLAEIKNRDVEEVASITLQNGKALFGIKE
ncbi:TatD family hydrolase [Christensenellaceae bacterium OttesenSCG-928-M15]|nr:TatD family hydrolase [Christensenellaceae bacterium OttesenSCG-928-M15]